MGVAYCTLTWRTITYTACLLASKFWEDVGVWNSDFVEMTRMYSLESTKTLECTFIGTCDYNLFVTADQYTMYFFTLMGKYRNLSISTIDMHENEDLKLSLLNFAKVKGTGAENKN